MDLHERTVSCNGIKNPDGGFYCCRHSNLFWQNIFECECLLNLLFDLDLSDEAGHTILKKSRHMLQ